MAGEHYDVIIIGSGPGGATMAWRLAQTGKRILLIERGDYLERGPQNWDSRTVFVDAAYQAKETWYGADGRSFQPGLHYYVGGNSKFYGAVLLRLREHDFREIRHPDGLSPAWAGGGRGGVRPLGHRCKKFARRARPPELRCIRQAESERRPDDLLCRRSPPFPRDRLPSNPGRTRPADWQTKTGCFAAHRRLKCLGS
jgi:choline dehydrogenase-like flavoprotein